MSRSPIRAALLSVAVALLALACNSPSTPTPAPSPTAPPAHTPAPSPTAADGGPARVDPPPATGPSLVEPDPDFRDALDAARFSTAVWETDFSLHTVAYSEILSGGVGRDGIPPLDDPRFVVAGLADAWLSPLEPVIALEVDGVAKAYPLRILTRHEVANDEIAGVPVAVTFCPLCNSAVVFDRRIDGRVLDFGVSGNLRNSDLIMWDRQTQSWWQQLTGEGIVGRYAGAKLHFIPAQLVSWETFRDHRPGSDVLSHDTGFSRSYGENPYVGYDRPDQRPFLFSGTLDDRLQPMERVAAVEIDGVSAAFPYSLLREERVVNYALGGRDIVVFYKPGTTSALDQRSIADSADVGSTGLFDARVDGRRRTFTPSGPAGDGLFRDDASGSAWNILGVAVAGPLEGARLERIVHQDHFWFAWAAFRPDTLLAD